MICETRCFAYFPWLIVRGSRFRIAFADLHNALFCLLSVADRSGELVQNCVC